MPEVVFETLINNATNLPAGGRVQSPDFDVSGAQVVNVTLSIPSNDADVHWGVHFGPTTNNAFGQCRSGTFGEHNTVAVSVPVFGTGMLVVVENRGHRRRVRRRPGVLHPRAAVTARMRTAGFERQDPGRRRSDRGVITCPVTTPGPMYIGTKRRRVNFQSPPSFVMSSK